MTAITLRIIREKINISKYRLVESPSGAVSRIV
jgi:hypothetical protein